MSGPSNVFIARAEPAVVASAAGEATGPLAGVTLAVKDNIDVAGFPTTAGCPSFAYTPATTAAAVARLLAAGAVVAGKANLDQFATGLVGTRSPYGPVESPMAPGRIAGGSSSGSAAAVALGLADLGIGTDTAGSGRVPAAFCGVVGIKPTRGWVPTSGVVPACASYDCVSVFAPSVAAAGQAIEIMAGPDAADPMGRTRPPGTANRPVEVLGVPAPEELASCDEATRAGFAAAVEQAGRAGYTIAEIDLSAYLAAGDLLYGGGLVAERYAAVGAFLAGDPPGADPTVAAIIGRAGSIPAWRYASDRFELAALAAEAAELWHTVDAILTPVAPRHPTLDEVAADPVGVNLALGRFTSGCNPVDWCAVVFATGAAPLGVQLLGPPWSDPSLWTAAAHLRGEPVPADADTATGPETGSGSAVRLAVAGAHLSGQPLNHQLTDRAATLELSTTTAPRYRMIAIEGDVPKPGLYRVGDGAAGAALEVEVWALEPCAFGSFVAEVPPPLAIGTIELADGSWVPGFICEPFVIPEATDITDFGGWRAWLTAR